MKAEEMFEKIFERLNTKADYYDESNFTRQATMNCCTIPEQIMHLCSKHFATLVMETKAYHTGKKVDADKCEDLATDIIVYMLRLIENLGD